MLADFPRLAFRTMPISGWVENHTMILVAALHFALAELHGVFGNPTNGCTGKTREFGVSSCPIDNAVRSIDMYDFGAGCRGSQRTAAGVGEEVEHTQGTAG